MASKQYLIKFGADTKSVSKAIQEINGNLKGLKLDAKAAEDALKLNPGSGAGAKKLREAYTSQLKGIEAEAKKVRTALSEMQQSGHGEGTAEYTRLNNKLKELDGEAGRVSAKMETLGSSMKSSSGGASKLSGAMSSFLGNLASNAVTAGVGMLVDGFKDMVTSGMEASDAMDKFNSTMKLAGKSSGEIDRIAASSKKYADETVYDLGDVMNTTAQLGANGVKNYDQLTQAAGNLNAQAGGNKDTFKSVAMMLTQTAGAGKLTTENWNQLADAIPGASGVLQEQMKKNGAYTGNFRDAMEKGEISAGEFNKAIKDLGMKDAAKEAATSTKTFQGSFGVLSAGFENLGKSIVDSVKGPVTNAMSTVGDAVSDFASKLPGMLSGIGKAFSGVFDNLDFSGVTDLMKGAFDGVVGAVKGFVEYTAPAFERLKGAFVNVWNAVQPLLSIIGQVLGPALTYLGKVAGVVAGYFMDNLSGAFNFVAGAIKFLMPVFQFLGTAMSNIYKVAAGVIDWFMKLVGGTNVLQNAIKIGGNIIKGVWDFIAKGIQAMWTIVSGIFGLLKGAWDAVGKIFQSVGRNIQGVARSLPGFFSSIPGKIAGVFSGIAGKIAHFFSGVGSAITNAIGDVSDIGMNIVKGIANGITAGTDWIKGVISGFVGNVKDFIKGLFGIHSPSRVMRDEVGIYITKGIGVGMEKGISSIHKAGKKVKAAALGSVSGLNARVNMTPAGSAVGGAQAGAVTLNINGGDTATVQKTVTRILRRNNLL